MGNVCTICGKQIKRLEWHRGETEFEGDVHLCCLADERKRRLDDAVVLLEEVKRRIDVLLGKIGA